MSTSPNNNNSPCACSQIFNGQNEKSVLRAAVASSVNANILADTLGVSPLYRQQDSARWQSAHQVYQSSRAHSPVRGNGGGTTPSNLPYNNIECGGNIPASAPAFNCVTPQQLQQNYYQQSSSAIGSPISLEDIAFVNRRRHQEVGDTRMHESKAGALELEAIAAVHELACSVKSIFVSEILPRTADLIFVNIKTHEDQPFTLELTMKGWRIASLHSDSMHGDYSNMDLHTRYFNNAREVLEAISPGHCYHFNDCLAERLKQLERRNKDNKMDYNEDG